ncbi:hypothetical protein [Okibacterium fritillariae]|uniref:hypothetical protein n=1 Tax=Okibacterium fritillariae TaxID=123320 RepID=UPI001F1ED871|nr:hypothetical protein [Okibacterium fritillariae]
MQIADRRLHGDYRLHRRPSTAERPGTGDCRLQIAVQNDDWSRESRPRTVIAAAKEAA